MPYTSAWVRPQTVLPSLTGDGDTRIAINALGKPSSLGSGWVWSSWPACVGQVKMSSKLPSPCLAAFGPRVLTQAEAYKEEVLAVLTPWYAKNERAG